jgi:ElaB/YqjD/DUF883 family membrane-anchored ribosome-binding protein
MNAVSGQQLTADLKTVISDAEALLKLTAGEAGNKLGGVREKLEGSLKATRERVADMEQAVVTQAKAAAEATDDYVHENPWPAIGIAAAAGLVLGVLIGRK